MELSGLRLKALRQEKNLTQKQLADKLDIVKASVSGYEQNSIYPSIEVLLKYCKYFNVSADYILGLSDTVDFKMANLTDEQITIILNLISQFEILNNANPNITEI